MQERIFLGNNAMKMFLSGFILILFTTSTETLFGQQGILEFFTVAESVAAHPPYKPRLGILAQKKLSNRYVTIIGYKEDKTILIAAVTLEPIKDVMKEISLSLRFRGKTPDVGKTNTWGYIYDRNGDGNIDYLALLGGAAPFKDSLFSEDYPLRGQSLRIDHMKYFVSNSKLVFNHWADDNFDGKLDALIHVDMEKERSIVDRRIIVRSKKFDGTFDDVWAVRLFDETVEDSIPHTSKSVPYIPVDGKESEITGASFAEKTEILKLLNSALKKSKLTAKNFFQPGQ